MRCWEHLLVKSVSIEKKGRMNLMASRSIELQLEMREIEFSMGERLKNAADI